MSVSDIILQLLLGWLIADFLSGFFHWLEDRVLWVGIPVIGKHVVVPNRLHHTEPAAFTRSSLLSRNSTTWIPVLAIAVLWYWLAGVSLVWLGALAGGLVVTEIHVAAHRTHHPDSIWRMLQEIGIVQSFRQHSRHHRGAMDRSYCILTGWLNPLLDWLRVWELLERLLETIGLEPNRGTR